MAGSAPELGEWSPLSGGGVGGAGGISVGIALVCREGRSGGRRSGRVPAGPELRSIAQPYLFASSSRALRERLPSRLL